LYFAVSGLEAMESVAIRAAKRILEFWVIASGGASMTRDTTLNAI